MNRRNLPESYFTLTLAERLKILAETERGGGDVEWLGVNMWFDALRDTCQEAWETISLLDKIDEQSMDSEDELRALVKKTIDKTMEIEKSVTELNARLQEAKLDTEQTLAGVINGFSWLVDPIRQVINLCGRDYAFALFQVLAGPPDPNIVFRISVDHEIMIIREEKNVE